MVSIVLDVRLLQAAARLSLSAAKLSQIYRFRCDAAFESSLHPTLFT